MRQKVYCGMPGFERLWQIIKAALPPANPHNHSWSSERAKAIDTVEDEEAVS